jgi:predicted esterase YcpF (UPF0227 family)
LEALMSRSEDNPMSSGVHEKVSWDNHERLVRLETKHENLTEKVDDMSEKVTEMHELLMQARGARWAIVGMASLGGFFAGKLAGLFPWKF